ncbi:hypothetical protein GQ53DRAFT_766796 [Thozetella sp. PMI_491]|nr:hypothetical protein GQ53DRAFT_766796 [Thozetella sp. PMI_491]
MAISDQTWTPTVLPKAQTGLAYRLTDPLERVSSHTTDEEREPPNNGVGFNDSDCVYVQRGAIENNHADRGTPIVACSSDNDVPLTMMVPSPKYKTVGSLGVNDLESSASVGSAAAGISSVYYFDGDDGDVFRVPTTPNCTPVTSPSRPGTPTSILSDTLATLSKETISSNESLWLSRITGSITEDTALLSDSDSTVPNSLRGNSNTLLSPSLSKQTRHVRGLLHPTNHAAQRVCSFRYPVAKKTQEGDSQSTRNGGSEFLFPAPASHVTANSSTESETSSTNESEDESENDWDEMATTLCKPQYTMDQGVILGYASAPQNTTIHSGATDDGGGDMTVMNMPFQEPAGPWAPTKFDSQTLEVTADVFEEIDRSWAILTEASAIPTAACREKATEARAGTRFAAIKSAAKTKAKMTARSAVRFTHQISDKLGIFGQDMWPAAVARNPKKVAQSARTYCMAGSLDP